MNRLCVPLRMAVALAVAAIAACNRPGGVQEDADAGYDGVMAFDTAIVRIEASHATLEIVAEIAEREEQQRHGLMERRELPENAGMLFVYSTPRDSGSGFWMFRTRIPLDVAFLDRDGRIVEIMTMQPCPSPNPQFCPTHAPAVPYSAALEMNQGFFGRHEVTVGDRIVVAEERRGRVRP